MAAQAQPLGPEWFSVESETAAYRGQRARSRALNRRAMEIAKQERDSEGVPKLEAARADRSPIRKPRRGQKSS